MTYARSELIVRLLKLCSARNAGFLKKEEKHKLDCLFSRIMFESSKFDSHQIFENTVPFPRVRIVESEETLV